MPDKYNILRHTAILQGLEQYVGSPNTESGQVLFSVENFSDTINLWCGIPLIYFNTPNHLDWGAFLEDEETELERTESRIVGAVEYAELVTRGSPRVEADVMIWDEEVNLGIHDGRIGLSTEFMSRVDTEASELLGSVIPSYVSVFPITVLDQQNDKAARFLNTRQKNKGDFQMEKEKETELEVLTVDNTNQESFFEKLLNKILKHDEDINTMKETVKNTPELETASGLEVDTTALDTTKAELEAANARIAEFEAAEAKRKEDALEANWTAIKTRLPAASLHGDGAEDALKLKWKTDPYTFMVELVDTVSTTTVANTATGAQKFSNTEKKSAEEEFAETGVFTMSMQSYNAKKGEFE